MKHKHLSKKPWLLRTSFILFVIIFAISLISLEPKKTLAACSAPSFSYGTDTMNVNAPLSGNYTVWVRMEVPSSTSNTILLQINGGTCFNVGGSSSIPSNTWTWVDYQNGNSSSVMQASLAGGNNSLELIGNTSGVSIDNLLLLENSCTPIDTGANCIDTSLSSGSLSSGSSSGANSSSSSNGSSNSDSTIPPILKSQSPSAILASLANSSASSYTPITLNKSVVITPTMVRGYTVKEALYYINNKLVYAAKKYPFAYTLNPNSLLNGKYTVMVVTKYTNGKSNTVVHIINIKHPFWKETGLYLKMDGSSILAVLGIITLTIWQLYSPTLQFIETYINKPSSGSTPPANPIFPSVNPTTYTSNGPLPGSVIKPSNK